jgi:aminoglycoside phosphotransferase (APT) family kinase protein
VDAGGGIDDALAREVAETGWGRREELSSVHVGLNRLTWKVGHDLWLTGIDDDRLQILQRENVLLQEVRAACARSNLRLDVPEVVRTVEGEDVIRRGGRAFRATAHIRGVRPDDNRLESFAESMLVLRRLHPILRELPADLAVLDPGVAEVRRMLTRCLSGHWEPVTNDTAERVLVYRVAEWLAPRLARLEEAPTQLIHGDWATPNLLVDDASRGHVVAVLDWQLCSIGPVMADVAHAVSGALMWSQLVTEPVVDAIFDSYGAGADRRLLGPAMAAYWFRNYWWAREELDRDERHRG